jgi:hypothetical protein
MKNPDYHISISYSFFDDLFGPYEEEYSMECLQYLLWNIRNYRESKKRYWKWF